jgi:hypothetical protein
MNLLGARFISRLLLSSLIADDTLICSLRRLGLRLRHPFLTTMFAALILHTLKVIFFWHRSPTLFLNSLLSIPSVQRHQRQQGSVPTHFPLRTHARRGPDWIRCLFELAITWRHNVVANALLSC